MEKSVINQICASMDTFFETEKKIGNFIIRHPKEIVDMTVGELAKKMRSTVRTLPYYHKESFALSTI